MVRDVANMLQECRLRWCAPCTMWSAGVGTMSDGMCLANLLLILLSVPGVRPLRRPKKCWLDYVTQDILLVNGLITYEVKDHAKWSTDKEKEKEVLRSQTAVSCCIASHFSNINNVMSWKFF